MLVIHANMEAFHSLRKVQLDTVSDGGEQIDGGLICYLDAHTRQAKWILDDLLHIAFDEDRGTPMRTCNWLRKNRDLLENLLEAVGEELVAHVFPARRSYTSKDVPCPVGGAHEMANVSTVVFLLLQMWWVHARKKIRRPNILFPLF